MSDLIEEAAVRQSVFRVDELAQIIIHATKVRLDHRVLIVASG